MSDPKLAFELQLRDQWAANQSADAHNWTDEAMAMVWSLGVNDVESWKRLPNYTRSQILNAYRYEQESLAWNGRSSIRPYAEACPPADEVELARTRDFAERMAEQLSADWSANRPPSIFTYDSVIASMVSLRIGRKVEAIAPRELPE